LFTCVVGLFGIPRKIISGHEVEVELPDKATLTDVIAALRRKIPTLAGSVICAEEEQLTEHYVFNINGRFYFDDQDIRIRKGDKIGILAAATGG